MLFGTTVSKIIIGMLLLTGVSFGVYFKWSQNKLEGQAQKLSVYELKFNSQDEVIKQNKKDILKQKEISKNVEEKFAATRKIFKKVNKKFNKNAANGNNDLGSLALANPDIIEAMLNRETQEANRCFEILSGASLTKSEINTNDVQKINSRCPDIANPNYVSN